MTHVYILTLQHTGDGYGDDNRSLDCGTFSTAEAAIDHCCELSNRKAKEICRAYDYPLIRWDDTPETKRKSGDDYYFLAQVEIDKPEDPYPY